MAKQIKDTGRRLKETPKTPKICPILMAGAMVRCIDSDVERPTRYHLFHEPVICLGDKCEWFDNGCPAHPSVLGISFITGAKPAAQSITIMPKTL